MDEEPQAGSRETLDLEFSLAYEELRRLASSIKRNDASATINATALVNEAWLKLAASAGFEAESRLHFKRIAARAMRQLLVEAARRRQTGKRDGLSITFDESTTLAPMAGREILALDAALDVLATVEPRQASVVEARFFGGLGTEEIAAQLGVSEATVLRDWRAAKAWLATELRHDSQKPSLTP